MIQYRIEEDSIGEKKVPVEAYYGVQALRAKENFPITGQNVNSAIIKSLAYIKKACAIANNRSKLISDEKTKAIVQACDEIVDGIFHDQFIVDPIQGGAGTSLNMNANEVIANRASEILGGKKGDYTLIHPNDHINMGQSTNDVIPTAGKLSVIFLYEKCRKELVRLYESFEKKAEEFDHIIKMGRTEMQDAVPVRLGQEFKAYATALRRGVERIDAYMSEMHSVNMGGTAIGTGINADIDYYNNIVPILSEVSGVKLTQCSDLIDGTMHIDAFAAVSSAFKAYAISLSKIANDLRLMSSGPRCGFEEINLPAKQNGSSIMPGKVNPVMPELISQICYNVIGNDVTITMAAEAGQQELNAFEPVTFFKLFETLTTLENGVRTFIDNCIDGITANEEYCKESVDNSVGVVTALCPYLGYKKSAYIAKKAIKSGEPIRELIIKENLMTEEDLNKVFDPFAMTSPGITEKDLIKKYQS